MAQGFSGFWQDFVPLLKRRLRFNQAKVRSTTQNFGNNLNLFDHRSFDVVLHYIKTKLKKILVCNNKKKGSDEHFEMG